MFVTESHTLSGICRMCARSTKENVNIGKTKQCLTACGAEWTKVEVEEMRKPYWVAYIIQALLFCMLAYGIGTHVKNGDIPIWAAIIIVILIVK